MSLLDANYILRYLLRDNEKMFQEAKDVIVNMHCLLKNEVIAEVVYVLEGVYNTPREIISETLIRLLLLQNMTTLESKNFLIESLKIYQHKNLDFVDFILCSLKDKYEVKSFDKKLMKCVNV